MLIGFNFATDVIGPLSMDQKVVFAYALQKQIRDEDEIIRSTSKLCTEKDISTNQLFAKQTNRSTNSFLTFAVALA